MTFREPQLGHFISRGSLFTRELIKIILADISGLISPVVRKVRQGWYLTPPIVLHRPALQKFDIE